MWNISGTLIESGLKDSNHQIIGFSDYLFITPHSAINVILSVHLFLYVIIITMILEISSFQNTFVEFEI